LCCSGFFVYLYGVKFKPFKRIPTLVACGVVALVCLVRCLNLDFFERLERITYDMRAREALKFAPVVATNLGFVFIDEQSLISVRNNSLGYRFGLSWPRQVYGRLVQELSEQGAKAVAFDLIFGELRPDHPGVVMADRHFMESDDFFALAMHRAGNVIIALSKDVTPPSLFLTNALAVADISTDPDGDGILRRAQAFVVYTNWHRAFRQVEAELGFDLSKARVERRQITLLREDTNGSESIKVPLDADGNFDLADFGGDKLPAGTPRRAAPYTLERGWHMGIVLAAKELKLDLAKAEVDLKAGRIVLRGAGGIERIIPVDDQGFFYIDWCLPPNDPRLTEESIQSLLAQSLARQNGETNSIVNRWQGKLAVVGSGAVVGNNLTDWGATPLRKRTLLVSKHWNVANSIITGRFVRRAPLGVELALIVLLGIIAALVTRAPRVLLASGAIVVLIAAYVVFGVALYVRTRYWIPLTLPIGGLVMTHVSLVVWRVVFEQAERRRVKSIFSKVVSGKIVEELLQAETLSLEGARREITVLFADVRGFTELTDTTQERVAEFVRKNQLSGEAAEACFDEQARETLGTVNLYLGLVADTLIRQDGTLDKFIGDCVMAFWGAPTSNPKHALACVRAAIDVQRAIYALNQQRADENKRREVENRARISAGLPPKPILPILLLGSGINTGMATVGLMGSAVEQANYTVFGREVNLASRLESASGRGRIFIGETTYQHLQRDDPSLAATCVEQPLINLKGFRAAVKVYEVPWRIAPALDEEPVGTSTVDTTHTGFVQRGGS